MNFDKIKAICKKSKVIVLYNTEYCQWLGDDFALYPLYEHPEYNKDTIVSVLSLDEKKRLEMIYRIGDMPSAINCSDNTHSDKPCGEFSTNLQCMGMTVIPLMTSKGLRFIETKYITPLLNSDYEFYERLMADGSLYIAVKVGFEVKALIQPFEHIITESLIDELNKIADGACETLTLKMTVENKHD